MLFCNKELYEHVASIKRGTTQLHPCLEILRQRISETCGIRALTLLYDAVGTIPPTERSRLTVVTETFDDFNKIKEPYGIRLNENADTKVKKMFIEVVREMRTQTQFNAEKTHIIAQDFSDEAMNQAALKLFKNDEKSILNDFSSDRLWKITGFGRHIAAFFNDENARELSLANGTAERIRQRCYQGVKQYDEFDYLTTKNFSFKFDTKENLDKNFKGNFRYYFG